MKQRNFTFFAGHYLEQSGTGLKKVLQVDSFFVATMEMVLRLFLGVEDLFLDF